MRRAEQRPEFACIAPVNAPFSCPKSIDSSMFSGIAAQFIAINGASLRDDFACKRRATTSLPVPVGPLIKTLALEPARRHKS